MARRERNSRVETLAFPTTTARPRKGARLGKGSTSTRAIAVAADRRDALDSLLRRTPPIHDDVFEAFMKEMAELART